MTLVMRIVYIVANWTSAQIVASINMERGFIQYIILTLHMMQLILQSLLWAGYDTAVTCTFAGFYARRIETSSLGSRAE